MNRKEAFAWISDNTKEKICMNIDKNKIICKLDDEGVLSYRGILGNQISLSLYVENDRAEFEVVRELRKMSFGVAYKTMTELNKPYSSLVSLISDKNYVNPIWNFSDEELEGKWTIKGIYED